jgi:hypothetical protein
MKYPGIKVFFLMLLVSCRTGNKSEPPEQLIKKFNPFLSGNWVAADYITEIEKTKSPLKSSNKIAEFSEFIIDMAEIKGDSMYIAAGLGNHEGADFILYFRQGQTSRSLKTNMKDFENESDFYELGYVTRKHDTSLVLYHYNKNKKLIDRTEYMKATESKSDDLGSGLQYLVNKKLISGTYTLTDTTGIATTIKFTDDGKVSGFRDFKTYYVITDFVAAPETVADEICFEIQTSDQECYAFKIEGKAIHLFRTAKDENDTLFRPGPPVYIFERIK